MTNKLKQPLFKTTQGIKKVLSGRGLTRRIPGIKNAYSFLFGLFYPYGRVIEVEGSRMYVDINHQSQSMRNTFRAYAANRIHEPTTTEIIKSIVKKGDVVLDLGANIGYFTLLTANLVGDEGRVYSFEPEPINFSYLTQNIELNNYNNVKAMQRAVSNKSGEKIKLYICSYESGHHTINQSKGIKDYGDREHLGIEPDFIEIEGVAIDDVYQKVIKSPVDFIKMDVEGAEMIALSGMERTIKESKNLKMVIEFFPLLIKDMGSSPEKFAKKLLQDYGFSVYVIGGEYSSHTRGGLLKINSVDQLMELCNGKGDHLNLFLEKKHDGA